MQRVILYRRSWRCTVHWCWLLCDPSRSECTLRCPRRCTLWSQGSPPSRPRSRRHSASYQHTWCSCRRTWPVSLSWGRARFRAPVPRLVRRCSPGAPARRELSEPDRSRGWHARAPCWWCAPTYTGAHMALRTDWTACYCRLVKTSACLICISIQVTSVDLFGFREGV